MELNAFREEQTPKSVTNDCHHYESIFGTEGSAIKTNRKKRSKQ